MFGYAIAIISQHQFFASREQWTEEYNYISYKILLVLIIMRTTEIFWFTQSTCKEKQREQPIVIRQGIFSTLHIADSNFPVKCTSQKIQTWFLWALNCFNGQQGMSPDNKIKWDISTLSFYSFFTHNYLLSVHSFCTWVIM